jgi:glycosyltransferase involved in cell wall biosynthesis
MDQVAACISGQGAQRPVPWTESDLRIAVLVPCYNEEPTIGNVVKAFRAELPSATVYVYDNNSTDRTIAVAMASGAVCRTEPQQGKGNVVRRMFSDIEADIYVMVDGDDTYDATSVKRLIEPVLCQQADMVNAVRAATGTEAYRPGHRFGNTMLTGVLSRTFGDRCTDMLSGYRAMSRRFVKSFPALSEGFEIETESPFTRWNRACGSSRSSPPTRSARRARSANCIPTATVFASLSLSCYCSRPSDRSGSSPR